MRGELLLIIEQIDALDQSAQAGKATIVGCELFHVREIEMDRRFIRREFERSLERPLAMEQPEHDLRPFQASAVQSTERRAISIGVVAAIHVVAIYALATGLASQLVQKGLEEIKAEVLGLGSTAEPRTGGVRRILR